MEELPVSTLTLGTSKPGRLPVYMAKVQADAAAGLKVHVKPGVIRQGLPSTSPIHS